MSDTLAAVEAELAKAGKTMDDLIQEGASDYAERPWATDMDRAVLLATVRFMLALLPLEGMNEDDRGEAMAEMYARALLEAEKRGREQERERCIRQARRVEAYYVPFIDERGTGGFEGASLVEAMIGSEAELELEDVANTLDVAIRTRDGE